MTAVATQHQKVKYWPEGEAMWNAPQGPRSPRRSHKLFVRVHGLHLVDPKTVTLGQGEGTSSTTLESFAAAQRPHEGEPCASGTHMYETMKTFVVSSAGKRTTVTIKLCMNCLDVHEIRSS